MVMDLRSAMHPPAYDSDDDAAARPGFCLLEKDGYFHHRQNATTAVCAVEKGTLQVTFCAVRPPRASYFCVHATGYRPTKFGAEPQILATEGPLALIRVILGKPFYMAYPSGGQYFVYHAGDLSEGRKPSLKRIPDPKPYLFTDSTVAIVRHCPHRASTYNLRPRRREEDHDCGYVIAALRRNPRSGGCYEILMYHSMTEKWTTAAPAPRPSRHWPSHNGGGRCKAISIGGEGGTVFWADLDRGIISCDVLTITDDCSPPVIRLLDQPLPLPVRLINNYSGHNQDIALVDGSVVYTELQASEPDIDEWKAAKWRMRDSSWHLECEFDSSGISKSLRRKLPIHATDKISFAGLPCLSLQDDGVLYMLCKTGPQEKAWLLAIDMEHNNVLEVVEFGSQRHVYLGRDLFIPSRISKYLKVTPGGTKYKSKRQKMLLQKQPAIPMEPHWDDDDDDADILDKYYNDPQFVWKLFNPVITPINPEAMRMHNCGRCA